MANNRGCISHCLFEKVHTLRNISSFKRNKEVATAMRQVTDYLRNVRVGKIKGRYQEKTLCNAGIS